MALAKEPEGWHLDKKVPIAIILTLVIQTGTTVWWASKQDSRVGALERDVHKHETWRESMDADRSSLRERIIRLEEQTKTTYEAVRRVESKIDALIPTRRSDADP